MGANTPGHPEGRGKRDHARHPDWHGGHVQGARPSHLRRGEKLVGPAGERRTDEEHDAFTQEALWEIGSTLTFFAIRNHVGELEKYA